MRIQPAPALTALLLLCVITSPVRGQVSFGGTPITILSPGKLPHVLWTDLPAVDVAPLLAEDAQRLASGDKKMRFGVTRPVELFELMCEAVGELTIVQSDHFLLDTEPELRLYLDATSLVLNSTRPSARIGRDPAADLVVGDTQSSRRHAEIELRGDKFVLIDRSSNGTFVQIEGEREFLLSREEVVLRGRGQFALGRSCSSSPHVVSFVCI